MPTATQPAARVDIEVTDDEDPTFVNCPEDLTVNNDPDLCGANVVWSVPVAADNCGVQSVTQTAGPAPGNFLPVGTTTIEYRLPMSMAIRQRAASTSR
jgi:hypothetical protein